MHGHDCYSKKPGVSWTVSQFTFAHCWSHLEAATALSDCDMMGFWSNREIQTRGDGKEQLPQHHWVWANITMVTGTWESSLYVGRRDIRKEHAVPYDIGVKHSWLQRKMWLLIPLLISWSCLSFMQKLLGNWKREARRAQLSEWVISAGQNGNCHVMLRAQLIINYPMCSPNRHSFSTMMNALQMPAQRHPTRECWKP